MREMQCAVRGAGIDKEGPYLIQTACGSGRPAPNTRTILAEHDGVVVGLAHALLGEDATWGALIDNLHVVHDLKRRGIGTRLLALTGQAVLDWSPSSGLYLWVLEQNSPASSGHLVAATPRLLGKVF
jgi:GNAT superfamily N-acetyltransferase